MGRAYVGNAGPLNGGWGEVSGIEEEKGEVSLSPFGDSNPDLACYPTGSPKAKTQTGLASGPFCPQLF